MRSVTLAGDEKLAAARKGQLPLQISVLSGGLNGITPLMHMQGRVKGHHSPHRAVTHEGRKHTGSVASNIHGIFV